MLLKKYTFLLLSFFSIRAVEVLYLKDLCAMVIAKEMYHQLPQIHSYEDLQKAYTILESPKFKKFIKTAELHKIIARAYQKLHNTDLLLWHRTLIGHDDWIYSVRYSQDSTLLASGSFDKTIKIWDIASGLCVETLEDNLSRSITPISLTLYSTDKKQYISYGVDNTINIRDLRSNKCIQTLKDNNSKVSFLIYGPENTQLTSGFWDNSIKIWNLKSGKCIKTLKGSNQHNNRVSLIAYSRNGMQLASCSCDNTIRIWQSYYQNPQNIEDVLFSLLSSFYITNEPQKIVGLYNSPEYKKLSNIHKKVFTDYIKRYAAEYPNFSM